MKYVGPQRLSLRTYQPNRSREKDLPTSSLPIFAVDPGGTTGWSLLVLPESLNGTSIFKFNQETILANKLNWWHGQINCYDIDLGIYQLLKIIKKWPSAAVVMESFNIRQMAVDLSPVKISATIRYELWLKNQEMFEQSPGQAKTTATDDRLRTWGAYTSEGGLQHARDADRHAILFMRRCMTKGGNNIQQRAWPHIYEGKS